MSHARTQRRKGGTQTFFAALHEINSVRASLKLMRLVGAGTSPASYSFFDAPYFFLEIEETQTRQAMRVA